MKKEIHPEYRDVLFRDSSADFEVVIGSTIETSETATFQGKEYPLYKVEISSASHPFYTGTQRVVDTEGRVEKFKKKYGRFSK